MLRWATRALLFLVLSAALGGSIVFYRPPDLTGIKLTATPGTDPSDMAETISQVVMKQSGKQSITEGDINAFLATVLSQRLEGLDGIAQPGSVVCDLRETTAPNYITWAVFGQPVTASAEVAVARQGADLVFETLRGSYGRLEVPRMLLTPVRPVISALAAACQPEIQALLTVPRLSIAKEKLVLDPTF
jgi:hypothetical protein